MGVSTFGIWFNTLIKKPGNQFRIFINMFSLDNYCAKVLNHPFFFFLAKKMGNMCNDLLNCTSIRGRAGHTTKTDVYHSYESESQCLV